MGRLISYFQRGLYYLNYINHALDGHQIHSPYVFKLYSGLIKGPFKYKRIHKRFLNMEEIHTAIRSEKKHRYIADLASLLGVESILYLHENSDRGSKKERNQIKFIATYPRDTPWVDTGVGLPPSQKLSLNENEIAIKLKASFNTLMQRDRYQMVIFDTSIMHNDPTGYLKILSSLHQLPKAIIFLNIHHDQKNHELWGKISSDTNILLTIDLFHIGLAFLDLKMEKQHFILKS